MLAFNVDLVGIVLFVLLGYLDDLILPKYYFYEDTIVGVYKKYQCPTHCGVNHPHLVYYDREITGYYHMYIDKSKLKDYDSKISDFIPVVVGTRMAKKAHLTKGTSLVLKWRDINNVVDAQNILVADIVGFNNPRVDEGVVWLRLDHLRSMTERLGEVSWVAVKNYLGLVDEVEFHTLEMLIADLLALLKQDRRNSRILWAILMFLAAISVFNTQILNIFKRQKEIGTLMAFGMDANMIIRIFVIEGSMAAFGAVILGLFMGVPFFRWFQGIGLDVSHLSDSTMPVSDRIFLDIQYPEVLSSVILVVLVMIFVSWWPVRKISKLDPTLALRGRAIS